MNGEGAPDPDSVAAALKKLAEAMRPPGAGTTDPDRRRAAARLADLIRTDDNDMGRFARRHLPNRQVDDDELRELRELAVGIARLVALHGRSADAPALSAQMRLALLPKLDELERSLAATPVQPVVLTPQPDVRAVGPEAGQAAVSRATYQVAAAKDAGRIGGVDDTADMVAVDPRVLAALSRLPFVPARATPPAIAPPATPSPPPNDARERQTPSGRPVSGSIGETMAVSSLAGHGEALPFAALEGDTRGPLPVHLSHIDASAHAVFSALLHVYPERHAEICGQYGVRDRAEQAALDRYWLSRLVNDAGLAVKWRERRGQAITYYRQRRQRG